jgi:hypothetical protein
MAVQRAVQRGTGPLRPGDLTQKLAREAQAKAAAKQIDVNDVRSAAFAKGYESGVTAGLDAAARALLSLPEDELLARRREFLAEFGTDATDEEN